MVFKLYVNLRHLLNSQIKYLNFLQKIEVLIKNMYNSLQIYTTHEMKALAINNKIRMLYNKKLI